MVVAGLDVGGTKTLAAAVAVPGEPLDGALDGRAVVDGSIVATVRRPTNIGSASVVLASITGALEAVAEAAGVAPDGFAAVGVGIPGLVDRGAGSVRHAVNLGLGDDPLPLAEHLGRLAGAPVVVDNDVNAAAVGAAAALSCTGDLAYLSVGTGVAAGFLLGGRIRRGGRSDRPDCRSRGHRARRRRGRGGELAALGRGRCAALPGGPVARAGRARSGPPRGLGPRGCAGGCVGRGVARPGGTVPLLPGTVPRRLGPRRLRRRRGRDERDDGRFGAGRRRGSATGRGPAVTAGSLVVTGGRVLTAGGGGRFRRVIPLGPHPHPR